MASPTSFSGGPATTSGGPRWKQALRRNQSTLMAFALIGAFVLVFYGPSIYSNLLHPASATQKAGADVSDACESYMQYIVSSSVDNSDMQAALSSANGAASLQSSKWEAFRADMRVVANRVYNLFSAGQNGDPAAYEGLDLTDNPRGDDRLMVTCGQQLQRESDSTGVIPIVTKPSALTPGTRAAFRVHWGSDLPCNLAVALPYGELSRASGLGQGTTDDHGYKTWDWLVSPSTTPGTATEVVTCNGAARTLAVPVG